MIKQIQQQIEKLEIELERIYDTYSGCDWCCGGGDEIVEELGREIEGLRHSLKVSRLREILSLRD